MTGLPGTPVCEELLRGFPFVDEEPSDAAASLIERGFVKAVGGILKIDPVVRLITDLIGQAEVGWAIESPSRHIGIATLRRGGLFIMIEPYPLEPGSIRLTPGKHPEQFNGLLEPDGLPACIRDFQGQNRWTASSVEEALSRIMEG